MDMIPKTESFLKETFVFSYHIDLPQYLQFGVSSSNFVNSS